MTDPFAPFPPARSSTRYVWDKRDRLRIEVHHDGDTVRVIHFPVADEPVAPWLRLLGIDAPEIFGETKEAGLASRDALRGLLDSADNIYLQTVETRTHRERKSLGRYVAILWVERDGEIVNVNKWMLDNGHADPYEP